MKNRILLQGRILRVCHHENEETDTKWDEFTYEFEYNGLRFEDNSKSSEGFLVDGVLEEGTLIDIWFYPDTQKYKIKYKRIVIQKGNNDSNTTDSSILGWIGLGVGVLGVIIGGALQNGIFMFCSMGMGFFLFGAGTLAEEIKFFIDRDNGKYKILNAAVVDFKKTRERSSHGHSRTVYKNVYEYIEDGEAKRYIGGGKRKQIGDEILIYKNISTGRIKEGTEWKDAIVVFIVFGGIGILMIYLPLFG